MRLPALAHPEECARVNESRQREKDGIGRTEKREADERKIQQSRE
jgi:hypothetical protein